MAGFTADQKKIDNWKKKYGEANQITVFKNKGKENEEKFICFLKDPYGDINLFSSAMAMKDDPMMRNMFLLDNLWIDGDVEFKEDNKVRIAGALDAYTMVEVLESEVKKH